MKRFTTAVALMVGLPLVLPTGCTDSPTEVLQAVEVDPSMLALAPVSGADQVGTVGVQLAERLELEFTVEGEKNYHKAVEGVLVYWKAGGDGSTFAESTLTDHEGKTWNLWTLGTLAGLQQLEVWVMVPSEQEPRHLWTFHATAEPGPPVDLQIHEVEAGSRPQVVGGRIETLYPLAGREDLLITAVLHDRYGNRVERINTTVTEHIVYQRLPVARVLRAGNNFLVQGLIPLVRSAEEWISAREECGDRERPPLWYDPCEPPTTLAVVAMPPLAPLSDRIRIHPVGCRMSLEGRSNEVFVSPDGTQTLVEAKLEWAEYSDRRNPCNVVENPGTPDAFISWRGTTDEVRAHCAFPEGGGSGVCRFYRSFSYPGRGAVRTITMTHPGSPLGFDFIVHFQ